jgi:hypothetical protein
VLAVLNIFVAPFRDVGFLSDLVYDLAMLSMTVVFGIVAIRLDEGSTNRSFWMIVFFSTLIFLIIRIAKVYILGYAFSVDKGVLQYINMLYIAPLLVICWAIFKDISAYKIRLTVGQIILLAAVALAFVIGTWFLLSPSILANGSSFVTILSCSIIAMFGMIVIIAGGVLVFKMSGGKLQITIFLLILGFFFMVVSQLLYVRDTLSGLPAAVNGPATLVAYYLFTALCTAGGLNRLDLITQEEDLGRSLLD